MVHRFSHQPAILTNRTEVKIFVQRVALELPDGGRLENTDQTLLEVGSTVQAREFQFWAL